MNYPDFISKALARLSAHGFSAFLVGGCVRDALLELTPSDYDIATPSTPEQTMRIFADYPCFDYGKRHGTIAVLIDGHIVEITTFRSESGYSDFRRPDEVRFSQSIDEDLRRRDFTVNALAYSPRTGYCDPHGGRKDLHDRLIRTVGDPSERFREDPLRILRAVRFASQLGFRIDAPTLAAMRANGDLLVHISAERKQTEITKALLGDSIVDTLSAYSDIFALVFPPIDRMKDFDQHSPHHIYDVLEHTARVVAACPKDPALRLAALFHDMGKVETYTQSDGIGHFYGHAAVSEKWAAGFMRELKFDKRTCETVCRLVKYHDLPIEPEEKLIKRRLHQFGKGFLHKLLALKRADALAQAGSSVYRLAEYDRLAYLIDEYGKECFSLKQLAVNGHDLLQLGLRGKTIGDALQFALDAVLESAAENTRAELIRLIKENYDKQDN